MAGKKNKTARHKEGKREIKRGLGRGRERDREIKSKISKSSFLFATL